MSSKHAVRRALAYCAKAKAMLIPREVDITKSSIGMTTDKECPSPETIPVSMELPYGRVVYVVERDTDTTHYELVQEGDLTLAALSAEQLHSSAVIQLTHFANQQLDLLEYKNNLWELRVGAGFEASLLLLTGLWTDVMPTFVGANPIVAIPQQDRIIVGGTKQIVQLSEEIRAAQAAEIPMQHTELLQFQTSGWITVS